MQTLATILKNTNKSPMPTINRIPKKSYAKTNKVADIHKNVYNTSLWRSIRQAYLMEHPLCEECLKQGKTTPATQVHHKQEIATGETIEQMQTIGFDYSNLEALCSTCHQQHHANKHKKNSPVK